MSFVVQPAVTVKIESASNGNSVDSNVAPNREVKVPPPEFPPDPLGALVTYLSSYDGADGDNATGSFIDDSVNDWQVGSVSAGLSLSEEQAKFGATSLKTSGNPLRYAGANNFAPLFANNAFTVEFFFYIPSAASSTLRLFDADTFFIDAEYSSGRAEHYLVYATNTFNPYLSASLDPFSDNEWIHIAVTRNESNTIKGYVNGVELISGTDSRNHNNGADISIGASVGSAQTYYMDEVRVTIGPTNDAVRYTGNFTPPTEPFLKP